MLAGRPSMISAAPMFTTCRPAPAAAVSAALRFSVDLYRLRGLEPAGTFIRASAGDLVQGARWEEELLSDSACNPYYLKHLSWW